MVDDNTSNVKKSFECGDWIITCFTVGTDIGERCSERYRSITSYYFSLMFTNLSTLMDLLLGPCLIFLVRGTTGIFTR